MKLRGGFGHCSVAATLPERLAKQFHEISSEFCAADAIKEEIAGVVEEEQFVGDVEHEDPEGDALRCRFNVNREEENDAHEPRSVEKQEHETDEEEHCD